MHSTVESPSNAQFTKHSHFNDKNTPHSLKPVSAQISFDRPARSEEVSGAKIKMKAALNIALLVFDGIQILDVSGPAAVFAAANDAVGTEHYKVHILSMDGGAVQSNCEIALSTMSLESVVPNTIDTMLIAGGRDTGILVFSAENHAKSWVLDASSNCRRFGSICTGAFALAHFGLLNGKRATTHWSACSELAASYPEVHVDSEALFVQDGRTWTSAGVSTGIDMCLAMVASDLGEQVSNSIARRLVLYAKRPGYQSQFSDVLTAQAKATSAFGDLVEWMRENLTEELSVPRLAAKVSMSERNFHRRFTESMAETPAHFVESLRLEKARLLLVAMVPLKTIAAATGYPNAAHFSKAFERRIGLAPGLFRDLHSQCND